MTTEQAKKFPSLSVLIFAGLVVGVFAGAYSHIKIWEHVHYDALTPFMQEKMNAFVTSKVVGYKIFSDIFLNLVKVIVAPLVFSLLLVGLTKTGSIGSVGRIGVKTMIYFT